MEEIELFLLKKNGSKMSYRPKFDCSEILIGSSPKCQIRITRENVLPQHCNISINILNQAIITNFSKENPPKVNDEQVPEHRILKNGDIIYILGTKLEFQLKSPLQKASLSAEKILKSRGVINPTKRITIHSIGSKYQQQNIQNDQTMVKAEKMETPKKETSQEKEATPFSTPTGDDILEKENTPRKMNLLNLSGTLITSYTPNTKVPLSSRLSQSCSPRTRKIHDFSINYCTVDSKVGTPEKNLPKKSMFLIDLSTPAPSKSSPRTPARKALNVSNQTSTSVSTRSTPASTLKRRTPGTPKSAATSNYYTPKTSEKPMSLRTNILLKSALKNSAIKKTPARTDILTTPKSSKESGSQKSTPASSSVASECTSDSIICINDSTSSAASACSSVITVDDTIIEQSPAAKPTLNESLKITKAPRILFSTPGKVSPSDLSDLEGIKELLATPEVIVRQPKELPIVESPIQQVVIDEPELQNLEEAAEDRNVSHVSNKLNETYDIHSTSTEPGDESNLGSLIGEEKQKEIVEETVTNGLENQPDLVDHHLSENEVEQKKMDLLKWMEEAKTKLNKNEIFEGNQVQQVVSNRYSNVTPNDSITATPEPVNIDAAKVSILEIEILKRRSGDSLNNSQLTVSPVSRLSVSGEAEIFANYKLGTPQNLNNEIPKSLRSTRKRIGNALTYLHNTSDLQEIGSDANDTLNASNLLMSENGIEEETEVEEQHILSLDDQPKEMNDIQEEPEAEQGTFLNNYIEFVGKTSCDYEPEDEVVEVDFNDKITDNENNENNDDSDDDDFTGIEYLDDDSTEEETDENEAPENTETGAEQKSALFSDTEQSGVELNLSEMLNWEDNDKDNAEIKETQNQIVLNTEMEQELPPTFENALSNGAKDLGLLGENILENEFDNSTTTPDDDNGNLNLNTTVPVSDKIEIDVTADLSKDNNIDEIIVTENVYEFDTSTAQSVDASDADKSVSILKLDETLNESIQETETEKLVEKPIPAELPVEVQIIPRKSIDDELENVSAEPSKVNEDRKSLGSLDTMKPSSADVRKTMIVQQELSESFKEILNQSPMSDKNTAETETIDTDLNEDELLCGSEHVGSEDLVLDEDILLEEPSDADTKMSDNNIFGSDLGSQEQPVTESSDNKLSDDIHENPIINEDETNSISETPEINAFAIEETSEDLKPISPEEANLATIGETSEDSKVVSAELEEKLLTDNVAPEKSEESAENGENSETQTQLKCNELEDENLFESKSEEPEESEIAEENPCVASVEQPEIEEPTIATDKNELECEPVDSEGQADLTIEEIKDNNVEILESENDEKPEEIATKEPSDDNEEIIPDIGGTSADTVEYIEESPKIESVVIDSDVPAPENDIKSTEPETNEETIKQTITENSETDDKKENEVESSDIEDINKPLEENEVIDEDSTDIPKYETPKEESVADDVAEEVVGKDAVAEEDVTESIPSTNEEENTTEPKEDSIVTELEPENGVVESTEPEKESEIAVNEPEIESKPELNEKETVENDVNEEVEPTVEEPIPISTNGDEKIVNQPEIETVQEANEDTKELLTESTEPDSEQFKKSDETKESVESEKPLETLTEVPKSVDEEETTKPKTSRKRILRGTSEQKEQEPVKRGRRAVSVDPNRLKATNEEPSADAIEEKRPTRNRPKKVPADFVATPSRSRRNKTIQEPVEEPEVVQEKPVEEEKTEEVKHEAIQAIEASVADATPARKATRGRQKKVQDEIVNTPKRTRQPRGQKVVQPIQSDEIASTSVDDDDKTVEKRTARGRANKVVETDKNEEPESTITDKEQNNEPTETVEEIAGPSKSTRPAKKVSPEETSESVATTATENVETSHEEPDEKRPIRSRKKKIISDFVETPSRRGRKPVEQRNTPAPEENVPRKRVAKQIEEQPDDTANSLEKSMEQAEEKPVKAKRGRKAIVSEEAPSTPLKRGRNATNTRSEKNDESEVEKDETEVKEETKKVAARRGRKVATVAEEKTTEVQEEPPKATGKRGKQVETTAETPVKTTTRRGRHAAEESKEEEPVDEKPVDEKPVEEKPVEEKPRRGRKKKLVEEEETPKATVKRGRHGESSIAEATVVETVVEKPAKITSRRGRNAEPADPAAADNTVEEKPRRGRKVEKVVEEETPKVVEEIKPKRGRKPTVDESEPAEVLPSPPKRGRRGKLAVNDDLPTSTPKSNSAASKLKNKIIEESHVEEVSHQEEHATRSLRTRKNTEELSSTMDVVVPAKRGRKLAETTVEHAEESVEKVGRSRRAASVTKSTSELSAKPTTRNTRNRK